ncbi:DUF1090 family protein [Salmonella enterica subsp. enterica]|nr:DUF1090 family protein [Salmonella enterica subsp. enterica]
MSYAEKHNNQRRIEGLNKCQRSTRWLCSTASYAPIHQKKIAEQRMNRQRDLAEAKQKAMRINRQRERKRTRLRMS